MSYILDALRKSELQRQRSVAPRLFSAQMSTEMEKKPALLLYGLVAAILTVAGIWAGWFGPWQQEQAGAVAESTTPPRLHESKLSQTVPTPQPLQPEPIKARKPEPVLPVQESAQIIKPPSASVKTSMKQDVPVPVKTETQTRRPQPTQTPTPTLTTATATASPALPKQAPTRIVDKAVTPPAEKAIPPVVEKAIPPAAEKAIPSPVEKVPPPAAEKAPLPAAEIPVSNGPAETAQEQKVITLAELPLAIQQEIPAMSISVHAYSGTPKERLVGINDRLLQEGETLIPGLRLEQITPDGLVFSYKKYLFRRGLQ